MLSTTKFLLLLTISLRGISANADAYGVITYVQGEASVFFDGSPKSDTKKTDQVLYEGVYYSSKKAKLGLKVFSENVLHTGANGKIRVVYPNSDQINIGPGSSLLIHRDENGTKGKLYYGNLRSTVARPGPGKTVDYRVVTPSATAGVRGTDFVVEYNPSLVTSEISVLRGKVEVAKAAPSTKGSTAPQKMEPVREVVPGQTLEIAKEADAVVKPTEQEHLVRINEFSQAKLAPEDLKTLDPSVAQEIKKTEAQALAKTIQDIKVEDPKLYESLLKQDVKSVNEINAGTVVKRMETAPRIKPEEKKKLQDELKKLDEGVYDKFKNN